MICFTAAWSVWLVAKMKLACRRKISSKRMPWFSRRSGIFIFTHHKPASMDIQKTCGVDVFRQDDRRRRMMGKDSKLNREAYVNPTQARREVPESRRVRRSPT